MNQLINKTAGCAAETTQNFTQEAAPVYETEKIVENEERTEAVDESDLDLIDQLERKVLSAIKKIRSLEGRLVELEEENVELRSLQQTRSEKLEGLLEELNKMEISGPETSDEEGEELDSLDEAIDGDVY